VRGPRYVMPGFRFGHQGLPGVVLYYRPDSN